MLLDRRADTEGIHPLSPGLDLLPTDEVIRLLVAENAQGLGSLYGGIPQIATAAAAYAAVYREGGRIFYIGAGTSGRLGFLDAAELPSTFGIPADRVQMIFPGSLTGASAERREDDEAGGRKAVGISGLGPGDLAIGITASGETPFVIGAIAAAKRLGARTAGITNNPGTRLERLVEIPIVLPTGPELIAGSTRLKAGTVQKVVLNVLSTAAMIALGKVYDGFMVGLRANNEKLRRRAIQALTAITGKEAAAAEAALAQADYEVDVALLILAGGIDREGAKRLLQRYRGNVRAAMDGLGGAAE